MRSTKEALLVGTGIGKCCCPLVVEYVDGCGDGCWVTLILENADLIRDEDDRVGRGGGGGGDGITIVGLLLLLMLLPKVSSDAARVDPSHEKSSEGQQWWRWWWLLKVVDAL